MFDQQKRQIAESFTAPRWKTILHNAPSRLSRGLPSIILAVLLNALDAASTGLLVFPSAQQGPAFSGLQVQAMSIYIMSTIMSQLAMTLGGSLFPGALGSMLIEVLPFVRGIATDIQDKLGPDSPKLLPTVMAAYTVTSFLIAFCFLALGLLRLGWMVEYIPSTVLNGTIGAIGLSLFSLGLELTLPPASENSSATEGLLTLRHAPLLVATILPTVLLCVSMRAEKLGKLTRGLTENAMYVPGYVFTIAAAFWIIVAANGYANTPGMKMLAAKGWLFTVQQSSTDAGGSGAPWNYWRLFDFDLIEWTAMGAAAQNILLLLIIGVLNLPIFIPAMGVMLNEPSYDMNWELIGHGVSNLLSGAVGSLPNLVVLANSRLFTFAGGGRPEALVATGFTVLLFFFSGSLLTFIPTIVASILVLFLGLDLVIEALWTSAHELLWSEWLVVLGTVLSCTLVGFLPGFFIGLGLAILQLFGWEMHDSRASTVTIYPRFTRSSYNSVLDGGDGVKYVDSDERVIDEARSSSTSTGETCWADDMPKEVVFIHGNPFFASIPSLQCQLDDALKMSSCPVIVDFGDAQRSETCIGQLLCRKVQQYTSEARLQPIIISGVQPGGGLVLDLARGGVSCFWPQFSDQEMPTHSTACYTDLDHALYVASNLPPYLPHEVSDHFVLEEADQLLGNVLHGCSVRHAFAGKTPHVHRLLTGEEIQVESPSHVFVVRGTLQAKGGVQRLDKLPGQMRAYTLRTALASVIGATLRSTFVAGRGGLSRKRKMHDDEFDRERTPLLRSIDGEIMLKPGDWCLFRGSTDLGQDNGQDQTLTARGGVCWAVSLPVGHDASVMQLFDPLGKQSHPLSH